MRRYGDLTDHDSISSTSERKLVKAICSPMAIAVPDVTSHDVCYAPSGRR
jgi:hypothetical protein